MTNIVSDRAPVKMSKGHDEKSLVASMIDNITAGKNEVEKKEKKQPGRKNDRIILR